MNLKTSVSAIAAVLCIAAVCAEEAATPATRPVPVPGSEKTESSPGKVAAPLASTQAKDAAKGSDEIPLADFDDSADAAKARPVVKLAPLPQGEKAERVEGEKAEAVKDDRAASPLAAAPDGAATSHPTGAQIATKYLIGDESARVDITSDDATLSDILRQFRKATGANIIYAESTNLQQRVSINLKRVPWLQAMTSILSSRGFRVESSDGIHFVKEDKAAIPVFTKTFLLNHASADELAMLFNESYGLKNKDGKIVKSIATAFQGANTVVVTADERVLADCDKIVQAVDKAVPQIYIEARFIELSSQAMHKLGVQWNQLESWGASVRNLSAGIEYNNGRVGTYGYSTKSGDVTFNGARSGTVSGSSSGSSSSSLNTTGSESMSWGYSSDSSRATFTSPSDVADAAGRSMNWLNARGFSGQLSADDFRIAMSAFEKMEDARVFSNPRIIVSNGKQALVDMTTKFPNIKVQSNYNTASGQGYTTTDTTLELIPGEDGLFAKTAFFSWGITLTVKPRISPDGLISVEIVPSISELDKDYGAEGSKGFYTISSGNTLPYGSYPILKFKRITTDFTMKDGATAVIGGLSRTEEGDVDSGIPYLRKIPWIGDKLFGWKSRGKVQTEILIFVTVGIADPANLPEDVGLPKNAVRGREYVEKRALEPGDRPNAAQTSLLLDFSPVDGRTDAPQRTEARPEYGTVTITPSQPE